MDGIAWTAPRFAGQSVDLGGTSYVVPPLSLRSVKELLPRIRELESAGSGVPQDAEIDLMLDVCLHALRRNYPAMTADELGEIIDLGNVKEIFSTVMGQSGLVKASSGNASAGTVAT